MTFQSLGTVASRVMDRFTPCEIVSTGTGHRIAWAAFMDPDTYRWLWVQRAVAEWAGCEPEEVGCLDGERITVRGAVVARMK